MSLDMLGQKTASRAKRRQYSAPSVGVVDFAQHAWSERGRDDGTSRLEKNSICHTEFFTRVPECLQLMGKVLLGRWPTVEDVMLQ